MQKKIMKKKNSFYLASETKNQWPNFQEYLRSGPYFWKYRSARITRSMAALPPKRQFDGSPTAQTAIQELLTETMSLKFFSNAKVLSCPIRDRLDSNLKLDI